jgi:hypothetical protein
MKSFISEDDIEQSLLQRLAALGWDRITCDPAVEKQCSRVNIPLYR